MNNAIVITPEQLGEVLKRAVLGALEEFNAKQQKEPARRELPENLTIDQAVEFLTEIGAPTAKGQIYNLTHRGEIPSYRYGSRLVFKRDELQRWAELRTKAKNTISGEAVAAVSRSARNQQSR